MDASIYTSGDYLNKHPSWDVEDAPFKAESAWTMIRRHGLKVHSVCEVGCGAGGVLRELHDRMPTTCTFDGYEISPQAFSMAETRSGDRIAFHLRDFTECETATYDLIILMDVIEHIEDYFMFLRKLRGRSRYQILHIPLDISAQGVIRNNLGANWDYLGHIHSFTTEVAIKALKLAGLEVLDHFYTYKAPNAGQGFLISSLHRARTVAQRVNRKWSQRILGGQSLLVLTRSAESSTVHPGPSSSVKPCASKDPTITADSSAQ